MTDDRITKLENNLMQNWEQIKRRQKEIKLIRQSSIYAHDITVESVEHTILTLQHNPGSLGERQSEAQSSFENIDSFLGVPTKTTTFSGALQRSNSRQSDRTIKLAKKLKFDF